MKWNLSSKQLALRSHFSDGAVSLGHSVLSLKDNNRRKSHHLNAAIPAASITFHEHDHHLFVCGFFHPCRPGEVWWQPDRV